MYSEAKKTFCFLRETAAFLHIKNPCFFAYLQILLLQYIDNIMRERLLGYTYLYKYLCTHIYNQALILRFQVLSISNGSPQSDVLSIQTNVLQQLYSSNKLFNFMGEGPNRIGATDVMICPEQADNVKSLLSTYDIPFTVKSANFQQ